MQEMQETQETRVQSLGWEESPEEKPTPVFLSWVGYNPWGHSLMVLRCFSTNIKHYINEVLMSESLGFGIQQN